MTTMIPTRDWAAEWDCLWDAHMRLEERLPEGVHVWWEDLRRTLHQGIHSRLPAYLELLAALLQPPMVRILTTVRDSDGKKIPPGKRTIKRAAEGVIASAYAEGDVIRFRAEEMIGWNWDRLPLLREEPQVVQEPPQVPLPRRGRKPRLTLVG